MLSPSSLPDISWRSSSVASGSSSHSSAPASNDPNSDSAGSFHDIFAQAASSPSSDQSKAAPNANSAASTAAAKPPDPASLALSPSLTPAGPVSPAVTDSVQAANAKGTMPDSAAAGLLPSGPDPTLALVKSLARGVPTQRAAKAETETPTAQVPLPQVNTVPATDNIPPGLMSAQSELPLNPSADKSSSSASNASAVGSALGASTAPVTGFSSLKDLSGAAFAMHITPAAADQGSSSQGSAAQGNAPENSFVAGLSAPNNGNPATPSSSATPTQAQFLNAASSVLAPTPAWLSSESAVTAAQPASSSPAISTAVEVDDGGLDATAGTPQTVRTVQVQLAAGDGQGRVDLRLVEHAGGLSVSVRAADSALTKDLQDNLPDLTARLAADKYQTHTFIPPASEAAAGGSSSSSEHPSGQSQDQSGGRSFSQGGDGGGRQKDGQPSDQDAAWWRQLAALGKLSSTVSSSASDSPLSTALNPPANL